MANGEWRMENGEWRDAVSAPSEGDIRDSVPGPMRAGDAIDGSSRGLATANWNLPQLRPAEKALRTDGRTELASPSHLASPDPAGDRDGSGSEIVRSCLPTALTSSPPLPPAEAMKKSDAEGGKTDGPRPASGQWTRNQRGSPSATSPCGTFFLANRARRAASKTRQY